VALRLIDRLKAVYSTWSNARFGVKSRIFFISLIGNLFAIYYGANKIKHGLKYAEMEFILENIHATIVFICFRPRGQL